MRTRAVLLTLAGLALICATVLVTVAALKAIDGPSSTAGYPMASSPSSGAAEPGYQVTGQVMIRGAFGGEASDCDYSRNAMKCLNGVFRKTEKLLSGESFPAPEGPGGGYADLRDGTQVVIRGADGDVLAVGSLFGGTLNVSGVTFKVSVPNVPDVDIYQVEVGNRNPTVISRDDFEEQQWRVDLVIGS